MHAKSKLCSFPDSPDRDAYEMYNKTEELFHEVYEFLSTARQGNKQSTQTLLTIAKISLP